jgi:carboxymethylenebutenolidase
MPDISYPVGGGSAQGYLAVPSNGSAEPGPRAGVVVIHEAFGLNADIRHKADQFAARGYLALAPDLLDGRSWIRCVLGAFRQIQARSGPAFSALEAARDFLAARADCTGKPGDPQTVLQGACPIVASYGGRDLMGSRPPERLERALTALQVPHDVKVYPDSGHRFLTETSGSAAVLAKFARMSYNERDADDAWRRIFAFFGEHLAG